MVDIVNGVEASIIVGLIIGILEVIKYAEIVDKKILPIIGIVVGIGLCWIGGSAEIIKIEGIYNIIFYGIVFGLTACGMFSGVKNLMER